MVSYCSAIKCYFSFLNGVYKVFLVSQRHAMTDNCVHTSPFIIYELSITYANSTTSYTNCWFCTQSTTVVDKLTPTIHCKVKNNEGPKYNLNTPHQLLAHFKEELEIAQSFTTSEIFVSFEKVMPLVTVTTSEWWPIIAVSMLLSYLCLSRKFL